MNTDEQAIRDVVDTWHKATAAGDLSRILPLMAEDVVFLGAGRPPMRGRRAFEDGLGHSFRIRASARRGKSGRLRCVAISPTAGATSR